MQIVPHPEIQKLKKKVLALGDELAILIGEHELLVHHVCGNIQAIFMTLIGYAKLELFYSELEVRKLRRKIELFQAYINQGMPVNFEEVEATLEREWQQWVLSLNGFIRDLSMAQLRVDYIESHNDDLELKTTFRKLSKMLHPDIHPNLPEKYSLMWFRVLDAYKSSNIEELRALDMILSLDEVPEDNISSEELLRERESQLEDMIMNYTKKIMDVKSKPPYTLLKIIEDKELMAVELSGIEAKKTQCNELIEYYQNILKTMGTGGYVELSLN